jgi:SpoVK/Ycf46/Vps4 family AAA+-type ATPase
MRFRKECADIIKQVLAGLNVSTDQILELVEFSLDTDASGAGSNKRPLVRQSASAAPEQAATLHASTENSRTVAAAAAAVGADNDLRIGNENSDDEEPAEDQANNPLLADDENQNVNEKLSLSCLLNILDGILETPGRIIIMTTNYPQLLDKALIRPGRIDLICEFTKCTNQMIIEFIENFYDIKLESREIEKILSLENYRYTPAEMTKILFENFDNNLKAIEYIIQYGNKELS